MQNILNYVSGIGKAVIRKPAYAAAVGLTSAGILLSACGAGQPSSPNGAQTQQSPQESRYEINRTDIDSLKLSDLYPDIYQFVKDAEIGGSAGTIGSNGAHVQGTDGCLNLRESPGASSPIKTCLPEGTIVYMDTISPQDRDGYEWRYIRSGDYEGWAVDEWVESDFKLGVYPVHAFSTDVNGSKNIVVIKGNYDCPNESGTGRAWVFDPSGNVVLDTGERGSIFGFKVGYLTDDNVPDLYISSAEEFRCFSDGIGPENVTIYDLNSNKPVLDINDVPLETSLLDIDGDGSKEFIVRNINTINRSISIDYYKFDGTKYGKTEIPRNVIIDTLIYDITNVTNRLYYPWHEPGSVQDDPEIGIAAYRTAFGDAVVDEALDIVARTDATRTEMASIANNPSYSIDERTEKIDEVWKRDPEIGLRALLNEGGSDMESYLEDNHDKLGLDIALGSRTLVLGFMGSMISSGIQGNALGVLGNFAAAYFVTKATESAVSGLTPQDVETYYTESSTLTPSDFQRMRDYGIATSLDGSIVYDEDGYAHVFQESSDADDFIEYRLDTLDEQRASDQEQTLQQDLEVALDKDPFYQTCKGLGLCQ